VSKFYDFLYWISNRPIGVAVKVAAWAGLSYFITNINDFDLPPLLTVAIAAGGVVLTDALNPEDTRFGR
jgi:hypothetical protein